MSIGLVLDPPGRSIAPPDLLRRADAALYEAMGPRARGEGEVEVGASLVAAGEAVEAGQPRQRSLHDPVVTTQRLAALDAAPTPTVVIALEGVRLSWRLAPLSVRSSGVPLASTTR